MFGSFRTSGGPHCCSLRDIVAVLVWRYRDRILSVLCFQPTSLTNPVAVFHHGRGAKAYESTGFARTIVILLLRLEKHGI